MYIDGVCHPPAHTMKGDNNLDNLTAGDIISEDLEGCNVPILVEHEGGPVGEVLATYRGSDNSLRMFGQINDDDAKSRINSGELIGLSIGSVLQTKEEGRNKTSVRSRRCNEISICKDPRRHGCFIDKIDGKSNRNEIWTASKKGQSAVTSGEALSTYVKNTILC